MTEQEITIKNLEAQGWMRTFTQAQMKLPPAYRIVGGDVYMTKNKTEALLVKLDGSTVITNLIEKID